MPTYNQIGRGKRIVKIKKKNRAGALKGAPHKKGVCVKIISNMSPKKPNSAKRKVAKVKISKYRKINCYIPGQGHDLREYSVVLVRGGRVKDLPGIQYHLIKGKFDFSCWERETRKNRRSIYGIKKEKNS